MTDPQLALAALLSRLSCFKGRPQSEAVVLTIDLAQEYLRQTTRGTLSNHEKAVLLSAAAAYARSLKSFPISRLLGIKIVFSVESNIQVMLIQSVRPHSAGHDVARIKDGAVEECSLLTALHDRLRLVSEASTDEGPLKTYCLTFDQDANREYCPLKASSAQQAVYLYGAFAQVKVRFSLNLEGLQGVYEICDKDSWTIPAL